MEPKVNFGLVGADGTLNVNETIQLAEKVVEQFLTN
jgi:hypothetical protein